MYLLSAGFLIFVFVHSAFIEAAGNSATASAAVTVRSSTHDKLLYPCPTHDIACLAKTTANFLQKTSGGIPKYNFRPIDPLSIPLVELLINNITVQLVNVTVNGLKNLKIKDFKMNFEEARVLLAMEANVNVVGDIVTQTTYGKFSGNMTHLITASYAYQLKPNEKGVEYFIVGKETLVCDNKDVPEVILTGHIDPVFRTKLENSEELRKKILCGVAERAYVAGVIHNLRASAKIFPKSAYFTDI